MPSKTPSPSGSSNFDGADGMDLGEQASRSSARFWKNTGAYLLMLAVAAGLFVVIHHFGNELLAPPAPPGAKPVGAANSVGSVHVIRHVLTTLAVVLALGWGLGTLCKRIGQPPVIGEVLAGIALGPSLLGAISPDAMHWLIPGTDVDPHKSVTAAIGAISQLGVILYMFLVGLELNAARLRKQAHAAVAISHASIVAPFILGAGLALWLYPKLSHQGVPFTSFALFLGVAMAITAFPVLARILTDRKMQSTELGLIALACAAADDVTAWCLLAIVVGVAQSQVQFGLIVATGALLYTIAMFTIVRPMVAAWCHSLDARPGPLPSGAIAIGFLTLLVSSLVTEVIDIHALFGAFLLGVIIPCDCRLAKEFTAKLTDPVTVLLLPAFFAFTGMRTQIGLVHGYEAWLICGVILIVATVGKFGGTWAAARLAGQTNRDSLALGALMNTRGLMELIVLNIGLDLGVISPTLFVMMVIMAIATTMATAPILSALIPVKEGEPEPAA